MARVTVEDCIVKIPNRFELVMLASQRARDVSAGAELAVERDNDKNPVVALREIAEEKALPDDLTEALLKGLRRHAELDEPEESQIAIPDTSQDLEHDLMAELEQRGGEVGIQVIDANDDEIEVGGASAPAAGEAIEELG